VRPCFPYIRAYFLRIRTRAHMRKACAAYVRNFRALLQICRALLQMCKSVWQICRALLRVCGTVFMGGVGAAGGVEV